MVNCWLAQLFLAARKSDENTGWMQILGFVILAIFYAIGSIVKARASKTAPKEKEQTPRKLASRRSRGLARKPPESTIDLQMLKQLFGLPEEAESSSQPSPEASKPLVRAKHPAVARQVVRPQVHPKPGKVTVEAAAPLITAERAVAGAEIPHEKYLSKILSDYEDAEKLRRAILHYEILGKPLSLREQERAF
jgi:hypothetical protein